jgi:polysaccharide export outer membrane protein
MRNGSLLGVAAVGLLAGCATVPALPEAPQVPIPVRSDAFTPYYLQVGDVLAVRLMLNPELNEETTVRPDGMISTTVVGGIPAAGHTVEEVAETLRRAYSKEMQKPRLTLVVRSFAATKLYVGGEVQLPGEYDTSGGPSMSLSQAIARAGGLKISGDDGKIFIIRRPGGSGATPQFLSVRYNDVMHGRDPAADVLLASYDVVYVPKTGISEVYGFWNQYVEQFVHPSVGFNYLINSSGGGTAVVNQPVTTGR